MRSVLPEEYLAVEKALKLKKAKEAQEEINKIDTEKLKELKIIGPVDKLKTSPAERGSRLIVTSLDNRIEDDAEHDVQTIPQLARLLTHAYGCKENIDVVFNIHGSNFTEEGKVVPIIGVGQTRIRLPILITILRHLGYRSVEFFSCGLGKNLSKSPEDLTVPQNILISTSQEVGFMPIIVHSGKSDSLTDLSDEDSLRLLTRDIFEGIVLDPETLEFKSVFSQFIINIIYSPETSYFLLNGNIFKKSGPKIDKFKVDPKILPYNSRKNIIESIKKFLEFCKDFIPKFPTLDHEEFAENILAEEIKLDLDLIRKYHNHAMIIEANRGRLRNVEAYLNDKTDLNTPLIEDKNRALHLAIINSDKAMAKKLIDYDGCDINLQNAEGKTPLFLAATLAEAEIAEYLIANEADPSITDIEGESALFEAVISENLVIIKCLLETKRININLPNKEGETPLFIAAELGFINIVECLIKSGANPLIENSKGQSPFHFIEHYPELEDLLAEYEPEDPTPLKRLRSESEPEPSIALEEKGVLTLGDGKDNEKGVGT